MKKPFTAFAGVFEQKLGVLKKDIKKELAKEKKDRRKEWLKYLLKEAKELRNLVHELKPKCPHCGKPI